MERLTNKNIPRELLNAEYSKLSDLEDIEEELGIDLINFYKNYRELLSLKGRNLRISIEELQKELEK